MIQLDEGDKSGESVTENARNVAVFGGEMEILGYNHNKSSIIIIMAMAE